MGCAWDLRLATMSTNRSDELSCTERVMSRILTSAWGYFIRSRKQHTGQYHLSLNMAGSSMNMQALWNQCEHRSHCTIVPLSGAAHKQYVSGRNEASTLSSRNIKRARLARFLGACGPDLPSVESCCGFTRFALEFLEERWNAGRNTSSTVGTCWFC